MQLVDERLTGRRFRPPRRRRLRPEDGAALDPPDIYLDEQSNELLRASITSRISTEFSIRGLPSDDPWGSVSGFEGTLSLTIERIF